MANTKISALNRYGKFYFSIEQNGKKKYYRGLSDGLEVATNPETGELIPVNPIQETKQVLSKELQAGLRKFRKDFIEYVGAYWDLVASPTREALAARNAYQPNLAIPNDIVSVTEDHKFDLLKHIKETAWRRVSWGSSKPENYVIDTDKDRLVKNGLQRYTKVVYKKFKQMHERENVPLGEMAPEDPY